MRVVVPGLEKVYVEWGTELDRIVLGTASAFWSTIQPVLYFSTSRFHALVARCR